MIIDGRQFEFKKLTMEYRAGFLAKQKQWHKEYKDSDTIEPLILSVNEDKKHWNWFINFAIKKNFLWKWFRIIPKQLRYGEIGIKEAEGLLVDFFTYIGVKLLAPSTQSENTKDSMTV